MRACTGFNSLTFVFQKNHLTLRSSSHEGRYKGCLDTCEKKVHWRHPPAGWMGRHSKMSDFVMFLVVFVLFVFQEYGAPGSDRPTGVPKTTGKAIDSRRSTVLDYSGDW